MPIKYDGYSLDVDICDLRDPDWDFIDASIYIVEHHKTLRETSRIFNVSKSSLHRWIHRDLPIISSELYCLVCKQFKMNLKNGRRKGGLARRKRKQQEKKI